jgi:Prealbumin-like fold domain
MTVLVLVSITATVLLTKYSVSASYVSGYTTTYSPECSGTASGGIPIKCTVTNQYAPLPGSTTYLNVVTKVDNTNGGTKQPSDFTISVSGNRPSPRTFSGSSSGTSVRLHSGSYEVVANSMPDYSTSYSPECSGTASGGIPIKCTINNEYHGTPMPPSPPNEPLNTTITSDSNSVYSIQSTFVKVDRFSTNYTIAGKISFINGSRDLITSTIVDNFDKNPNIGYVVSNSSSLSNASQPGRPNPFVSKDIINQKITNETQITAASVSNPPEKSVEIKCTFGMILADYKCIQK